MIVSIRLWVWWVHADWNAARIECRGDSIKTWINGVPVADLKDSMSKEGLIALQVHGIGSKAVKAG